MATRPQKASGDQLVAWMEANGVTVTRENYIGLAFGSEPPEWTPELEDQLPEDLQDWSKFKLEGDQLIFKG